MVMVEAGSEQYASDDGAAVGVVLGDVVGMWRFAIVTPLG